MRQVKCEVSEPTHSGRLPCHKRKRARKKKKQEDAVLVLLGSVVSPPLTRARTYAQGLQALYIHYIQSTYTSRVVHFFFKFMSSIRSVPAAASSSYSIVSEQSTRSDYSARDAPASLGGCARRRRPIPPSPTSTRCPRCAGGKSCNTHARSLAAKELCTRASVSTVVSEWNREVSWEVKQFKSRDR